MLDANTFYRRDAEAQGIPLRLRVSAVKKIKPSLNGFSFITK